ncbi:3276_t:CDS:2, partial [Entrophospora sp. SA101]
LFPLNTPVDWHDPNKKIVVNQLNSLIGIGFKLTRAAMVNSLCFCKSRLDIIGDSVLIESFCEVRKEPKYVIIQKCLIEITQVDREVKNDYKVLDFLSHGRNGSELEFIFLKTIIYHFFDTETKKGFDNLEISIIQSKPNFRENYVSISGQVKLPKKIEDSQPSFLSSSSSSNNIKNTIYQNPVGNNYFIHQDTGDYFVPKDNNDSNLSFVRGFNSFIKEEDNDDYFTIIKDVNSDNNNQLNNMVSEKWLRELKKEYNHTPEATNLFKDNVIMICNRINKEKG